jgi:hypothetical protein
MDFVPGFWFNFLLRVPLLYLLLLLEDEDEWLLAGFDLVQSSCCPFLLTLNHVGIP